MTDSVTFFRYSPPQELGEWELTIRRSGHPMSTHWFKDRQNLMNAVGTAFDLLEGGTAAVAVEVAKDGGS